MISCLFGKSVISGLRVGKTSGNHSKSAVIAQKHSIIGQVFEQIPNGFPHWYLSPIPWAWCQWLRDLWTGKIIANQYKSVIITYRVIDSTH